MQVLIVEPYKQPYRAEITGDLASMQKIVHGYIHAKCYWEDNAVLICNEEGKLLGLTPNRAITGEDGNLLDFIAGTFLLCGADGEEFCSLPDELIEKYRRKFWILG